MAVDLSQVASSTSSPASSPKTMAAWVIREERDGEPIDAFQLEEIEVPEPGAFEVIVRVMAAGVNYNNVWAALGKPVSVMKYGDHPEFGHHIGGSDASGVVWKVGAGVTRWKPGDEVVVHCNQASYEDPEVHGLDPMAAPSQQIWGYETTWGSFAQFTKVQAQQLLPKPKALTWEEAASYGLVYFTAYRMLMTSCNLQAGHKVLIWGAAGGLGVFADAALRARRRAVRRRRLLRGEGRARQAARRDRLHRPQRVQGHDAQGRRDARGGEGALQGVARASARRVEEILGGAPDIVFEHVGEATFPTSVLMRQAVRQGRHLRRHHRLQPRLRRPLPVDAPEADHRLALRQRLRVHEGQRADRVRARSAPCCGGRCRFDGVGEAHQLMNDNKHLGKISILVGAEKEGLGKTADGPGAIYAEVGA